LERTTAEKWGIVLTTKITKDTKVLKIGPYFVIFVSFVVNNLF